MQGFCKIVFLYLALTAGMIASAGQTAPLSERVATNVMTRWKDSWETESGKPEKWSYEQGVVLRGIESVWYNTADGRYFKYIQRSIDRFVNDDGTIKTYKLDDYNLDNVLNGRVLLLLYKVTGQDKYRRAADLLREQLKTQPRTSEGGFWHKKVYPSQMWLDGLYMAEPFYAEYAATFHEDADFDDIAKQFALMELHARDVRTGLLYHGWDESRKQRWANRQTGTSPNFWGRAVGWYAMALVDTLDYFPKDHPQRNSLIAILKRLAVAVERYQDRQSGLWFEVLDQSGTAGNYAEASVSSMFVYALAKGVREGYLSVGGLGGDPYRDGSYRYYLSEKVVNNDPKGLGAFLLASSEMETAAGKIAGPVRTVTLDYYFNSETKKDATGRLAPFHYKWEEMPNSGFSLWGHVFHTLGARTEALAVAPTAENLKKTDIYIIVDPDTREENENPHYLEENDIKAITNWVKSGGVLVLMSNDFGNAEFDHFNRLAREFGIQFNRDSRNKVTGNDFAMGLIATPDKGDVIMAVSKLGQGTVFAVGDPWFYNEYLDGRKLPLEFDNFKAAKDLSRWLIQQLRK